MFYEHLQQKDTKSNIFKHLQESCACNSVCNTALPQISAFLGMANKMLR